MTTRTAIRETHHAHSMTENELKAHILKMAKAKGWLRHHVTQAKHPNAGDPGYPDITLARRGVILLLELKQEHGKETLEQVTWSMELPNYEVIRPSDLARGRVDELLA